LGREEKDMTDKYHLKRQSRRIDIIWLFPPFPKSSRDLLPIVIRIRRLGKD
jgi:hypothetical protein